MLTEAITDKRITEYSDGKRTWYLSEQVKVAFPEVGRQAPPAPTVTGAKEPLEPNLEDRVVEFLRTTYPSGRPSGKNQALLSEISKPLGRSVGMRTLNRAIQKLEWAKRR